LTKPPAEVSIGGRGQTANDKSIALAQVTLTNAFGYYRFEDVGAGETYIVNVFSKRYSFAPQVVTVTEDLTDLNFTAHPNAGKNSLR